jgi:hypothetical protein
VQGYSQIAKAIDGDQQRPQPIAWTVLYLSVQPYSKPNHQEAVKEETAKVHQGRPGRTDFSQFADRLAGVMVLWSCCCRRKHSCDETHRPKDAPQGKTSPTLRSDGA